MRYSAVIVMLVWFVVRCFGDITQTCMMKYASPPYLVVPVYPSTIGGYGEVAGRQGGHTWVAADGTMYIFGGQPAIGYSNDMWKYDAVANKWVLVHNNTAGMATVLPPGGVGNYGGFPRGREGGMTWTSKSGKLYLFGGRYDDQKFLGDFWSFDPLNPQRNWTWVSGSMTVNYKGDYTKGLGKDGAPSCKMYGASFTTSNGLLWMFGGYGLTSKQAQFIFMNDMWAFNETSKTWRFMSGSAAPVQPKASTNTIGGRAYTQFTQIGNFFYVYGGSQLQGINIENVWGDFWIYNTSSNTWRVIPGSPTGPNTATVTTGTLWPSCRMSGALWYLGGSTIWMTSGATRFFRNYTFDIWSYDTFTGYWSLYTNLTDTAAKYPSTFPGIGQVGKRYMFEYWTVNGKFWLYSGFDANSADLWVIG